MRKDGLRHIGLCSCVPPARHIERANHRVISRLEPPLCLLHDSSTVGVGYIS